MPSFYRSATLLKGHTTSSAFADLIPSSCPEVTRRAFDTRDATFTYRTRLLHLLHIRSVDRREIQPSYCFPGATSTHRQRPTSLRLVLGQRALTARSPLRLHMGIRYRYLILTHCSYRHFVTCRHQGAEKPSLTSQTRPFFVRRDRSEAISRRFLGRGLLLPLPGFRSYHRSLVEGLR